jgi:4-amino-4-deoxy-L-arabinose transferase-like glycosyltransferase
MNKLISLLPITILLTSLFFGVFFRFHKLGQTPAGFYIDEASIGYNAFSVLKTGRDEFGKEAPLMFRSFSTFQSPIYTYLTIPFVAVFGLNPFSVRLPSAVSGSLTILLVYILIKSISSAPANRYLAPLSSLILALSPWHITYSRTAYEANIALFFLVVGLVALYQGLKKPWLFVVSSLLLSTSMLAYRAEIMIVPAFLVLFLVFNLKNITANAKQFIFPILVSTVFAIVVLYPTLKILRTPGFQARTTALSIFSNAHEFPWGKIEGESAMHNLLNNSQFLSLREFASLYASYFSPRYIFSLGDSGPRKPYPDLGSFFVWQLPLYILGLWAIFKDKEKKNLKFFVLTLLFVSPIPAALTRDPYSTLRSLPMVIPLAVILALGLTQFLQLFANKYHKLKYLLVTCLLIFSSIRLYISVFYHHDYFRSDVWSYGWQEAVDTIADLDPNLPIIVDGARGHPYIELLFFLKYDPSTYQKDNFEVSAGEYYTKLERNETKKLGRITVKGFQWGVDTDRVEKYLITDQQAISNQQILEHKITIIKDILYPNGQVALRILKTNPPQ